MDSIAKRVNKLQQSQIPNQKIPSFGLDFRTSSNHRRNSDHAIQGSFQTAQLVNPSQPRSPAKFMAVSQESSLKTNNQSHPQNNESRWTSQQPNSLRWSEGATRHDERPKSGEPEARVDRGLTEDQPGARYYPSNNISSGRSSRGLPRPDSMFLPKTVSLEKSEAVPEMTKTSIREKSILNFNIQPTGYKVGPMEQSKQPQQQKNDQHHARELEQQLQQPYFYSPQLPHQLPFQHPQQHPQHPQQQQLHTSYTQPMSVLQQASPSYLLVGDINQLAGLNQGPNPSVVPTYSGMVSSLFGLIGNQPGYLCTPQQALVPHRQPEPVVGYQQVPNQMLPNSVLMRPQVAIVATDPGTLRALLTGGLNPQTFLQPIIIPTQPPLPTTTMAQVSNQFVPAGQSVPSGNETSPYANYSPQPVVTSGTEYMKGIGSAGSQAYASGTHRIPSFGTPVSQTTFLQTSSGIPPVREHSNDAGTHEHSVVGQNGIHQQPTQAREPIRKSSINQKMDHENSLGLSRDVVVRSRHATSGEQLSRPQQQHTPPTKECRDPEQQKPQEFRQSEPSPSDTVDQVVPRIGHPPRTLRFLARPEATDGSAPTEEVKHIPSTATAVAYREPKKLEAISLFEGSRSSEKPLRRQLTTENEAWTAGDSDTLGRRRDPNSISAYYERIKQRGNRPLSAYRPNTVMQDEDHSNQENLTHVRSTSSASRTAGNEAKADKRLDERKRQPVRRAVTFANEKSHSPEQDNHIPAKDPSVMSVAERTRRWLQVRERDLNDRYRYSTCGFIDQDLIDCQDLVPVEDRVKMFDSGMHLPKDPDDMIPTKLESDSSLTSWPNLDKPVYLTDNEQRDKRATTPSKTVASVKLQTTRSTIGGFFTPRSAVGLQHLRLGTPSLSKRLTATSQITTKNEPEKQLLAQGDELASMSLAEKRRIFSRENPPKTANNARSNSRRKTQPVTLDDLARANQLILARLDGRSLESPSSILRDDNESFGFPERASEVSTPEASILNF
ncbi:hypothetical protein CRM22_001522 [Opisthorchis felineus]|uniref:Uncharacterized protein n=1 Tax=Opisthorchis felineus TaxID=147828 RepID=A0A4S2MA82_OPIFE|nr:hypothetical protein CRM22_001522 [Opisthorchis felineus]